MHFIKSFCFAVILSLLFIPAAFADTAVAEFKKIHGLVDVFHAGEKKAVVVGVGATVVVGDTVRTGRRSRAQLQLADGSVLNIGSLTKIQIGEFSFDAEKKIRKSSISDLRGKVRAVVSKSTNKNSFFQIKTPGAVAAVRGTGWTTDAISPNESVFYVDDGTVQVTSTTQNQQNGSNQSVSVRKGQFTRVFRNEAPTPPARAPAGLVNTMILGTQQVDDGGASSGSTGSGVSSGTAAAAPVNSGGGTGGGTAASASTQPAVPQTTAPTVQAGAVVPVVATPPIVLTTPAVQNQNVNIVIQF